MIRRLDRSGLLSSFSNASSIRDSITGTTTTAVTLCFSMSSNTWAGLNLLCSTNVEPRNIPMVACRKPSAWNIGAGSDVTSLALNGTCDRIPPIGAKVGGGCGSRPSGCRWCRWSG